MTVIKNILSSFPTQVSAKCQEMRHTSAVMHSSSKVSTYVMQMHVMQNKGLPIRGGPKHVIAYCPLVITFSLTIVLSLMEPKLRMNSSHPTSVGWPEDQK